MQYPMDVIMWTILGFNNPRNEMFQWEGRWSHVGAMLDSDFSHSTGLFINEDGDAKVKGTGYDPSSYSESYDKREGDILIAGFKDNYEPQMGFNSCVPTGIRITSYNVCYTKLLRICGS